MNKSQQWKSRPSLTLLDEQDVPKWDGKWIGGLKNHIGKAALTPLMVMAWRTLGQHLPRETI
ncbi:hypothetical protein Plhal304r1_c006g0026011 [Plasmopara halstedii]